jgi:chemotaxis protein methyltransferase CheR
MDLALDKSELGELSDLVADRLGLAFGEDRWPDLLRGLRAAGAELGFEGANDGRRWLAGPLTARQVETLASHLTVSETYFFREPGSFAVLSREILPPLVARRASTTRSLRLWSAGCCTGEEAYSLAIACARGLPDLPTWRVSVLGTDINLKSLRKAETGVYGEWSFRNAPEWLRAPYFSPAPGKKFSVAPFVKSLVHFSYLNLAQDRYPSLHNETHALDVIFFRNVLMYFTPEHQARVAAALHRCLVDDGVLLVAPVEASSALFSMFKQERFGDVMVFRKATLPVQVPVAGQPTHTPAPVAHPPPAVAHTHATAARPRPRPAAIEAAQLASAPRVVAPAGADALTLARRYANEGRLVEAAAACQNAIAADRSNPAAQFLHAVVCRELGRLDDAVAALGKVLYLDQDFILAHHTLGGLYRQLGKVRHSRRHLDIALQLLAARARDELVPESEGMTCGRLAESIRNQREV